MKTDQDVGGDHLVAGEPDDVAHPDVLPETLNVPVETPAIKAKNVSLDCALGNQNWIHSLQFASVSPTHSWKWGTNSQ